MTAPNAHFERRRASKRWLIWFLFLFLLDFLIPFTWLSHFQRITGAFLFWIIWILVAIVSMFMVFLKWRD